jgi:mono/diheme cytochrome c family protein
MAREIFTTGKINMDMNRNCKTLVFISLLISPVSSVFAAEIAGTQQLFEQKCSLCHAIDKKKLGPAVTTMNREAEVLRQAITKGKNSMPSFEGKLTGTEIDALVDYLLTKQ